MNDMTWQPIETAPTNQSVLVWLPNCEHYGDPVYRAIQVDMGTGRRWMATAFAMGRDLAPHGIKPTHWMPLPEPPKYTTATTPEVSEKIRAILNTSGVRYA